MGTFTNVGNKIVADFMDQWMKMKESKLSPTTVKSYRMFIDYHFKPYFKMIKFNSINELIIKKYIAEKLKVLSSCTVRKHFFLYERRV